MTTKHEEFIEKRLNLIVNTAGYLQGVMITIAVSLLYFKPNFYKEIGQTFSVSALFASFIISRVYIYTGRELEECKTIELDEKSLRLNEYFLRFFAPYILWVAFSWLFS